MGDGPAAFADADKRDESLGPGRSGPRRDFSVNRQARPAGLGRPGFDLNPLAAPDRLGEDELADRQAESEP